MPNLLQNTINKFALPKKKPNKQNTAAKNSNTSVCVPRDTWRTAGEGWEWERGRTGTRERRTMHRNEATVTSCGHTLLKDPEV